jgi:hypothetical protein
MSDSATPDEAGASLQQRLVDAIEVGDVVEFKAIFKRDPRQLKFANAFLDGEQPIHVAAAATQRKIVELLIGRVDAPNARGLAGGNSLHTVPFQTGIGIRLAKILMVRGTNGNAIDSAGKRPLTTAMMIGNSDLGAILQVYGATECKGAGEAWGQVFPIHIHAQHPRAFALPATTPKRAALAVRLLGLTTSLLTRTAHKNVGLST